MISASMIHLKSHSEIEFMRESCRLVSDALRLIAPECKPGASLSDLDRLAEDFIRSNGGRPAFKGYSSHSKSISPFPATLCISIDSEVVHGIPGDRRLTNGEIVSIDVGVEKNGFFGDGAVTMAVGEVSPSKLKLMDVTRESLYRGLEAARPGKRLGDVSAAIQKHVEDSGFSVVRDLVGHGIGRNLHEEPKVPNYGKSGTGPVLEEGMTLAVEPMVNAGGWHVRFDNNGWTVLTRDASPSAHFEHTVLISAAGAETLTNHFRRSNGETGSNNG